MANAKKEPTAISLVDAQAAIDRRERSTSITQFTPKKKGRVIKKRQSTNNIYNYHSPSNYPQSPPMDSISRGNSYLGGKLMPPMLSDLSRSTSNPGSI